MVCDNMNAGSGYTWTQTKADITLHVQFPAGTTVRDVSCSVALGSVSVGVKGRPESLMHGELWEQITSSVWSFESAELTMELEKRAERFWPSVLCGDPEVDVRALLAKEKKEKEPVFKPDPGQPPSLPEHTPTSDGQSALSHRCPCTNSMKCLVWVGA